MTRRIPWDESEKLYLRTNAQMMTSAQMGDALGRSQQAVQSMAARLGVRITHQACFDGVTRIGRNPMTIGRRDLLAKTCKRCGKFKMARHFSRIKSGRGAGYWYPDCYTCIGRRSAAVGTPKHAAKTRLARALQALTLRTAYRHSLPWEEQDVRTLKDVGKPLLAVAIELGRTYSAVRDKAQALGIVRKPVTARELRWIIQWQHGTVLESLATDPERLKAYIVEFGHTLPSTADWEWDD